MEVDDEVPEIMSEASSIVFIRFVSIARSTELAPGLRLVRSSFKVQSTIPAASSRWGRAKPISSFLRRTRGWRGKDWLATQEMQLGNTMVRRRVRRVDASVFLVSLSLLAGCTSSQSSAPASNPSATVLASATATPARARPTSTPLPSGPSASAVIVGGRRHTLRVADGLQLTVYTPMVPTARFMALGPGGDIFVGSFAGSVWVLPHTSNGQAAHPVQLLTGLSYPHSVAYHGGLLYVAEQSQVLVMRYDRRRHMVSDRRTIISGLPTGGRHVTRTMAFGPDGRLYLSIGSSCDACVESDPRFATIMRYNAGGTGREIYAHGLRNAVGLAFQPGTGRLWATDNGQDDLGDTAPPDEIDLIRQGENYGWPYCWGNRQRDPVISVPPGYCAKMIPPAVELPAHVAALGLTFYAGRLLPSAYRDGLFVAYHGSTHRSAPVGYKVVFIPVSGDRTGQPQDFITGWLPSGATSSANAWGRPVGLLVASDGSLLLSDDRAGVIYRVAPKRQ